VYIRLYCQIVLHLLLNQTTNEGMNVVRAHPGVRLEKSRDNTINKYVGTYIGARDAHGKETRRRNCIKSEGTMICLLAEAVRVCT